MITNRLSLLILGASATFTAGLACTSSEEPQGGFPDAGQVSPDPTPLPDGSAGPHEDGGDAPLVPPSSAIPASASGTRLRRILVGPAGSPDPQLVGFRDLQLNLDCTVADDYGQGVARCAPSTLFATDLYSGDAACSDGPLVRSRLAETGCATHAWIAAGLAPITPAADPALPYRHNWDGSCQLEANYVQSPAQRFFSLGAPIPNEQIASWFAEDREPWPNLRARTWVSSDGARSLPTFQLVSAGVACTAWPDRDGIVRCLPGPLASASAFADEACTIPAVVIDRSATVSTSLVRLVPKDSCIAPAKVYATGGGGGSYALSSEGICTRQGSGLDAAAQLLEELEPSQFGSFGQEVVPAGPRLSAVVHTSGTFRETAYYTDSERAGAPCRFLPTEDGSHRCLPFDPQATPTTLDQSTTTLYTDSTCAVPKGRVAAPRPARCGGIPDTLLAQDASACPARESWNVYPLEAEIPAAGSWVRQQGGYCRELTSGTVRPLGAPLSSGLFAEGIRSVE